MKRAELLKTNHGAQLNWLKNQVLNITNDSKSFKSSDFGVVERAHAELLGDTGQPNDSDVEHFVSVYLSDVGMKRLVTTLRMHLKRSGEYKLQVQLDQATSARLHALVRHSGKTQVEVVHGLINKAFEDANVDQLGLDV